MPLSFLPEMIFDRLTDVTAPMLLQRGITTLLLDFDNTIVPYTTSIPTPEMDAWLHTMLASEVRIAVVSNSRKPRVQVFCQKYGIDCITHARKPFQRGIREALKTFRLEPDKTALVGDQIYTDVLGANCGGLHSILISAIHNHTVLLKLRHAAELPFIAMGKARIRRRSRG